MPVYNGIADYPDGQLRQAVMYAMRNDLVIELSITNDASTDGSQDWLEYYGQGDQFVKLATHDTNQGVAAALNTAAEMATGRYFIVQSVRSWYEPGALATMAQVLDNNPGIGFVYGQTQYHGASERLHTPPPFSATSFYDGFDSLFGYMYRREAWDVGCRYANYIKREGRNIDISDYDFVMQLIVKMGYKGLALRDTLILHYLYSGTGQMTNLVHKYGGAINAIFQKRWPRCE
jgi:glycosyltransferase involved in cell wall biosynthesis